MTVPQVVIDAIQHYRSKGISKDAAVAIVSCLWYESKLRPGSQGAQSTERPGALNPSGAYGIASWNGPRQAALSAFAQKKGLNVGDLYTQLDFVLTESANLYPRVWAAITSTQGYDQIIPIFVAEYENPKDHAAEINAAMLYASGLYAEIPLLITVPPVPQPTLGVQSMPTTLDPVLVSVIEALLSGLVKAILQHATTASVTSISSVATDLNSTAVAKSLATELGPLLQTLTQGVKL